jgi:hypothetical protein
VPREQRGLRAGGAGIARSVGAREQGEAEEAGSVTKGSIVPFRPYHRAIVFLRIGRDSEPKSRQQLWVSAMINQLKSMFCSRGFE